MFLKFGGLVIDINASGIGQHTTPRRHRRMSSRSRGAWSLPECDRGPWVESVSEETEHARRGPEETLFLILSVCTVHIDITLFDQSSFFPLRLVENGSVVIFCSIFIYIGHRVTWNEALSDKVNPCHTTHYHMPCFEFAVSSILNQ